MRILSIIAIIVFVILSEGCSGNSNRITQPELKINDTHSFTVGVTDRFPDGSPAGGEGMLGLFNLNVDPVNMTASLVPVRKAALTDVLEVVDLTNFLELAPCTDCVKIKSVSLTMDGKLDIRIGIRHPFAAGDPFKPITGRNRADLHVFNVEGIVVSNAEAESFDGIRQKVAGFRLTNADGYTGYLDSSLDDIYPTDATIHPYILHFDDYSAGNFNAGNPMGFATVTTPPPSGNLVMAMGCDYNVQDYIFDFPPEPINFIYAVGCTYALSAAGKAQRFTPEYRIPQHNKKAASEVHVEIVSNDLKSDNTASSAQLAIKVLDINHGVAVGPDLDQMVADSSVSAISVEIPGVLTSPVIVTSPTPTGGSGRDPLDPLNYDITVTNSANAAMGTYSGLVKVLDSYPPGSNESPVLHGSDGIHRVDPGEIPTNGTFQIDEFATYQFFSIDVALGLQITLTAPNGGEVWNGMTHHDITWITTGPVGNVKLEYSKDNFASDIHDIDPDTANDGIYDWFVPNDPTTNAKVRVSEVSDPTLFDISDAPFTIVQSIIPIWPYFGCDARGSCLSAFNGTTSTNIKWTYDHKDPNPDKEGICSAPSIGPDGTIYCGIYKTNGTITSPGLVAINPSDGSLKWRHFPAIGNYYGREPAVSPDGQRVYYGGDSGLSQYHGIIYCLKTSNGSKDWSYEVSGAGVSTYELIDGGPKIGPDGSIYFQTLRPMGVAHAWGITSTGAYKWHQNIIGYSYSDMLYHSPCIGSDGNIYLTDSAGQLHKFDSAGAILWPTVYVNYTTKYPGSLDANNNFIVACDEGRDVNKFAPDGTQLWMTTQWDFNLHCAPAQDADGFIYATGGWDNGIHPPDPNYPAGYRLRKMKPDTGDTVWEKPLEAISTALMAVSADGHIYVGCGNGSSYGPGLQCWDTDGNLIFKLDLPYQAGSPAIGADGTIYVEANHVLYAVGD